MSNHVTIINIVIHQYRAGKNMFKQQKYLSRIFGSLSQVDSVFFVNFESVFVKVPILLMSVC